MVVFIPLVLLLLLSAIAVFRPLVGMALSALAAAIVCATANDAGPAALAFLPLFFAAFGGAFAGVVALFARLVERHSNKK